MKDQFNGQLKEKTSKIQELEEDHKIALKDLNLEVITQKNTGSAQGWHKAIEYALDNNFDINLYKNIHPVPQRWIFFFLKLPKPLNSIFLFS